MKAIMIYVQYALICAMIVGFQFVNSAQLDCEGQYGVQGNFSFLENTSNAYFIVTSEWLYFEYLFPFDYWIGIGASNQTNYGESNLCLNCVYANNENEQLCLTQCIGNNVFVITGEGDPDTYLQMSWNVVEMLISDTKNSSAFNQFKLPAMLNNGTVYNVNIQVK